MTPTQDNIERWLADFPDGEGADEVRGRLREYRAAGRAWVASRREAIERHVAEGRFDYAIAELRYLLDHGALPEWLTDERERLAELEARRR